MNLNEAITELEEHGYLIESEISDTIQNYFNHEVMNHRENLKNMPKGRLGSGKKDRTEEAIANYAWKRTNEWVSGVIVNAVDKYLTKRDYERIDWDLKLSDFFNDKTIDDYENPEIDWSEK